MRKGRHTANRRANGVLRENQRGQQVVWEPNPGLIGAAVHFDPLSHRHAHPRFGSGSNFAREFAILAKFRHQRKNSLQPECVGACSGATRGEGCPVGAASLDRGGFASEGKATSPVAGQLLSKSGATARCNGRVLTAPTSARR